MHQPARNMFSSFIFFPLFLSLSRRGLFSLRETARPSRYPASVELRARLFEPRVVLGLVSTASETRKGWNDGVAAHSRSRNDINIEEGGENLSKFFLYFSRFLLSFDFWIFSLFLYVTIKTIGRTLCLIIKYAASMNYSFDFYFWNYIIALEICPFATFHRLLRVLNISFFEFPRAASDDYQLPEKE